jgi:UDP-glucuronate 4-epimerase
VVIKWNKVKMTTLVTGSAGFIGSALTLRLLNEGHTVIGLDNHSDYYDPAIKEASLARFIDHPKYTHYRVDLVDRKSVNDIFKAHDPEFVVNLAAQAGVRYSIENPLAYIDSNISGFANILEGCRHSKVRHLVYASSSSVYGANTDIPFSTHQSVNHPLSLYAASKKANELMAHSYSHLYSIPTTGLRFFTVYGPWGRPDMALFKFAKAILSDEPIQLYNRGKHLRDFTYIDDIVEGVLRVLAKPAIPNSSWNGVRPDPATSLAPWKIYNIGNSRPVELLRYVSALESALGKQAKKVMLGMQAGDVPDTHADISDLIDDFDYKPKVEVEEGVVHFVKWYKEFYKA